MVTLQAALASGRKFRKVGSTGGFDLSTASAFSGADVMSTAASYELAPEVTRNISLSALTAAWNAVKPAGGSVAAAPEGQFFSRLAQQLGLIG